MFEQRSEDQVVKESLQKEIQALVAELERLKIKSVEDHAHYEKQQEEFYKQSYKTRSELLEEIGELEKKRDELINSADNKKLQEKLKEVSEREKTIAEGQMILESAISENEDLKKELNRKISSVLRIEQELERKMREDGIVVARLETLTARAKEFASKHEHLLEQLHLRTIEWGNAVLKAEEHSKTMENVIMKQMQVLKEKEESLAAKSKHILSQQSALKAGIKYAKD